MSLLPSTIKRLDQTGQTSSYGFAGICRRRWAVALALTAGMLVVYHANGDFLPGNDATANLYLPVNLLRGRGLSFQPDSMPQMFLWHLQPPTNVRSEGSAGGPSRRTVRVPGWDRSVDSRTWQWLQKAHASAWPQPPTWDQLYQAGWLCLAGPEYYLTPSKDPDRLGYVNQYGPGAGLTALPLFALLDWYTGDLEHSPAALWYGGKWVASLCVAVSVSLVYLTLCWMIAPWAAFGIALLYGTATCVWSVSSQTLWQSGPNVLFLALAVYCLVHTSFHRAGPRRWQWVWAAGAGMSAGWATVCRPTSALLVAAVACAFLVRLLLLWRKQLALRASSIPNDALLSASAGRMPAPLPQPVSAQTPAAAPIRSASGKTGLVWGVFLAFVAGTLPPAVFLAGYNSYFLGAPWRFGQVEVGRRLAQNQLGTADAWSGNFLEGLYGQLISPGRGLLVYSPILAFSIWGMALAWRDRRYRMLRPLSVAILLLLLVQSKWFNWHGGWSFGYRLMVDAMPLAAVCAAPTIRWIRRYWGLGLLAGVLAAWSIGVQILGAFAYDVVSWNCREGLVVRLPDGRAVPVQNQQEAVALVRQTGGAVQRVLMDVDQRPWRARLWSWKDNPLWYYLRHFSESRQRKHELMQSILHPP